MKSKTLKGVVKHTPCRGGIAKVLTLLVLLLTHNRMGTISAGSFAYPIVQRFWRGTSLNRDSNKKKGPSLTAKVLHDIQIARIRLINPAYYNSTDR